MKFRWMILTAVTAAGIVGAHAADGPRVLFLHKSAGFEHSVVNMYFMPLALFIRQYDPAFVTAMLAASANPPDLSGLSWSAFLVQNLLPVTLGNILGGGVLVGLFHWLVFAGETTREAHATSNAHESLKEKHAG